MKPRASIKAIYWSYQYTFGEGRFPGENMNRSFYGIVFMSLLVASMLLSGTAGAVTSAGLPTIISVSRAPNVPNYYQNVVVSAIAEGADECVLSYVINGVDVGDYLIMDEAGNVFNATIPGQPYGTTVQYWVTAYNGTTANWVESDGYSYTVSNNNNPAPALFVSIIPHYAALISGQSQLFNATVTGGSPPYMYQWFQGLDPIPGATDPTYNYTATQAGGDIIFVYVTDSAGVTNSAFALPWEPMLNEAVYYAVEPVPTAPLTNVNASINGLETPSLPSPVGEDFTVEIHLRNATATNVPAGVAGVEVHFYFGNLLTYCKPIGFEMILGNQAAH